MNNLTAKRVIKRQYNTIIDEEAKIRRVLSMETDQDPRAQIRRAGGYEAWDMLTPMQREMV